MSNFNRLLLLMLFYSLPVLAQEPLIGAPPPANWPTLCIMDLPLESRKWTLNTDGSCVQCSNSLVGMWMCDFNQATLLFSTEYGRAERGGSGPDRVARYCRDRGIEVYNVTGRSFADTKPWMDWAAKTGRFAAVGCFGSHFQTLYGRDFANNKWIILNNWSGLFDTPYVYTEEQFRRQHEASGAWIVIPKRPPPSGDPIYVKWWTDDDSTP